jgi:hypothetical protein
VGNSVWLRGSQGVCQEMTIILQALKIKSVLSVYALVVSKYFGCLVVEKLKSKVLTT